MLSTADVIRIKAQISRSLQSNARVSPSRTIGLLPIKGLQGKLYEASVLADICENLVRQEGYTIKLVGGPNLMLKQKGGPINRSFPYFEVWKNSNLKYELFTDLYFNTLSYHFKGSPTVQTNGDYHELDIALIEAHLNGIPKFSEVVMAVECKNTTISKNIIRELLGYRRELSFVKNSPNKTIFNNWPIAMVYAQPSSVHILYTSDIRISRYSNNCSRFGIVLNHFRM